MVEGARGAADLDVEGEEVDAFSDGLLELGMELELSLMLVVGGGVQVVVGSGLGVVVGLGGFQVKVGLGIHSLVVVFGGGAGAPSLKYQVP